MNLPIPGNTAVWLLVAVIAAYLLSYFLWHGKRRPSYADKLRDPRWRSLRREVLELYSNRCAMCDGRATVVHHKRYLRGEEPWSDEYIRLNLLIALCWHCHTAHHRDKISVA